MKGKKSTCFVAIKDDIINAGAEHSEDRVVVDGNMYAAFLAYGFNVWHYKYPFTNLATIFSRFNTLKTTYCFTGSRHRRQTISPSS